MRSVKVLLLFFIVLLSGVQLFAQPENSLPIRVFTSILPQKYFVERIGAELVSVEVLVGPGMSPRTYEPLPQQMSSLSRARMFFAIGVPFEKILREKLGSVCPDLKIIDTDKGIQRRQMQAAEESGHEHHDGCNHSAGEADPHIWLDPMLVVIQARNIAEALKEAMPEHSAAIEGRLQTFIADMNGIVEELTLVMAPVKGETMLVFHPAFGYFADRFGVKQQAIEIEGKEPAPRQLVDLIRKCRDEKIHVVFVQKQFPVAAAETVARSINGSVAMVDPLSEKYLDNLRSIAEAVARGLQKK
jgi:zinc transport system substrate-binding protein